MESKKGTTLRSYEAKLNEDKCYIQVFPLLTRKTGILRLLGSEEVGGRMVCDRASRTKQGSPQQEHSNDVHPPSMGLTVHAGVHASASGFLCGLSTSGLGITETGTSGSPLCLYSPVLGCTRNLHQRACTLEVCGHSASPAAGRRLGPHFCTSCWAGVPYPCYYEDKKMLWCLFPAVWQPQQLWNLPQQSWSTPTQLPLALYSMVLASGSFNNLDVKAKIMSGGTLCPTTHLPWPASSQHRVQSIVIVHSSSICVVTNTELMHTDPPLLWVVLG